MSCANGCRFTGLKGTSEDVPLPSVWLGVELPAVFEVLGSSELLVCCSLDDGSLLDEAEADFFPGEDFLLPLFPFPPGLSFFPFDPGFPFLALPPDLAFFALPMTEPRSQRRPAMHVEAGDLLLLVSRNTRSQAFPQF